MSWKVREYLEPEIVCPFLLILFVGIQLGQCSAERDEDDSSIADVDVAAMEEEHWRLDEMLSHAAAVREAHAADFEEWCEWWAREPDIDRPRDEWCRWLESAPPIHFLARTPHCPP